MYNFDQVFQLEFYCLPLSISYYGQGSNNTKGYDMKPFNDVKIGRVKKGER